MERRSVNPWRWQDDFGFVQAEEVKGAKTVLYCAGQTATDAQGTSRHPNDMRAQLDMVLNNVETVLGTAGYAMTDIVRLNFYTTNIDLFLDNFGVVSKRLHGVRYASTLLGVAQLAGPGLLVEMEVTAAR